MKKNLLFLLFVLFTALTNAQSFQKDFFAGDSTKYLLGLSRKIIEENNKFCTFYNSWADTNHSELHYLELNATTGDIITDSIIFRDSFPARTYSSLKISNNHYVFVNINYNSKDKENNGKIILTDAAFNVLLEKQLPIVKDSSIDFSLGIYEDSQSNLIFNWSHYIMPTGSFITYYFKTTLALDSLDMLIFPNLTCDNFIDDTISHKYVVTSIYGTPDTNIIYFYNYDFSLDTFLREPNFIQNPPTTSQNNYLRLSNTRFVYSSQTLSGIGGEFRNMGIYLYRSDLHLLTYKNLGASLNSSPTEEISLSKINDKYFYFSGQTNWNINMVYHNDTNSIVLYKLDTNLNVIWTRYYNQDLLHYPFYSMTTKDKGCLIFGALYAYTGFFFLKVDSMGNLQWSHGLDVEEKVALVYPNPVENVLYVDNGLGSGIRANLLLYDVNGRQIISKPLVPQMNSIDVSSLPQGVYFYRIADTKKVYQSGKVVKQ